MKPPQYKSEPTDCNTAFETAQPQVGRVLARHVWLRWGHGGAGRLSSSQSTFHRRTTLSAGNLSSAAQMAPTPPLSNKACEAQAGLGKKAAGPAEWVTAAPGGGGGLAAGPEPVQPVRGSVRIHEHV